MGCATSYKSGNPPNAVAYHLPIFSLSPLSPATLCTKVKYKRLFHGEASVLGKLKHSQIPHAWAFAKIEAPHDLQESTIQPFQTQPFFYLVQDFIDGQNLTQELNQKGQFSEAEIIENFAANARCSQLRSIPDPPTNPLKKILLIAGGIGALLLGAAVYAGIQAPEPLLADDFFSRGEESLLRQKSTTNTLCIQALGQKQQGMRAFKKPTI